MINFQLLSQCPVFTGIEEIETERLLSLIHFQVKNFESNDVVVHAGDSVKDLYVVLLGSVRGERIDFSGKTVKIEDIEAPKPLATAFLYPVPA